MKSKFVFIFLLAIVALFSCQQKQNTSTQSEVKPKTPTEVVQVNQTGNNIVNAQQVSTPLDAQAKAEYLNIPVDSASMIPNPFAVDNDWFKVWANDHLIFEFKNGKMMTFDTSQSPINEFFSSATIRPKIGNISRQRLHLQLFDKNHRPVGFIPVDRTSDYFYHSDFKLTNDTWTRHLANGIYVDKASMGVFFITLEHLTKGGKIIGSKQWTGGENQPIYNQG